MVTDEKPSQALINNNLGGVLWRAACIDDSVRAGFLIRKGGSDRLTSLGSLKLLDLIMAGWRPPVPTTPGDQEQQDRILEHLAYEGDRRAFREDQERLAREGL